MNELVHENIWNNCLKVIKDNIPASSFQTWFEPIVPVKLENKVLTIQVPSPFFYEYLEEKYLDILKKTIRKELGNEAKLEYNILMENGQNPKGQYTVKYPGKTSQEVKNRPVKMPLPEEGKVLNPFIIPGIKKVNIDPRLNPNYNFGNYIEGDCNRLARSAGFAVSQRPGGTAFNPLFIYGESGVGKTHLAQAIGIETKEKYPEKVVLYVTANVFQTQFVESVIKNNKNDFLYFYQMIDVLIIDDVHEFSNKEKTQDIFFHIFNHLHQSNKQIILTSDKAPVDIQGLEQRLLSRFKWGLSTDIQVPDFETRVAIVKRKLYNDGIVMPTQVIEFIANNVTSNVRDLESALISLLAQSTLNKKEITIELAKEIIEKLIKNTKREISVDYIQKVVCNYYNLSPEQMQNNTRKRETVQARQVAMYFCKNFTKSSLASIGSQIGGKDHATVLHAYKTVNNLLETDKNFKRQIEEIEKKLKF